MKIASAYETLERNLRWFKCQRCSGTGELPAIGSTELQKRAAYVCPRCNGTGFIQGVVLQLTPRAQ